MMGPGPSNAYPRVLNAMALPLLGHLHVPFLKIMDECQTGLRHVFQTEGTHVLLGSGTGHFGMEMTLFNLLERGDAMVVGVNGLWGQRVADIGRRLGCVVTEIQPQGGRLTFTPAEVEAAVKAAGAKVFFVCQGESSTGAHQSMAGLSDAVRRGNPDGLLLVDTVCSLGGVPLEVDAWGVDAVYSGSQKCLSGPPGAAPVFFSDRAMAAIERRATPVASFNMDARLVGDYWGWYGKRSYHHTGSVSVFYAMREALSLVSGEGMHASWARHQAMHERLWDGLTGLGLSPYVKDAGERLCTVNTIDVPEGVDFAAAVKHCMDEAGVEIAGGLGPSAGKAWRVGVMGANANPMCVDAVVSALGNALKAQGWSK